MVAFSFLLNEVAQVATALGICVAAGQLIVSGKQALTTFEDSLNHEYRELASRLPTKALLGKPLTDDEQRQSFDEFYRYFDLSNEQVFLRQKGRISRRTWTFWRDGIKSNLRRPAFVSAWAEINTNAPEDFSELRKLVQEDFAKDPKSWGGSA